MRAFGTQVIAAAVMLFSVLSPLSADEAASAWVPVAMHVCSTISDGSLPLEEIVSVARAKGLRAVFLNERDAMKWEFGLWPLRRFLKLTQESNSVHRYGALRYLEAARSAGLANPGVVVIPGLEVAPYYRWEGVPFTKEFTIRDWHKHILVYGLEDPRSIEALPTLVHAGRLRRPFTAKDLPRLWPFLAAAFGVWAYRRRRYDYRDDRGIPRGPHSRPWRAAGIVFLAVALLSVLSDNPFAPRAYDQYGKQPGAEPYQRVIDYAAVLGGLSFWAHPEASYLSERQGVKIQTEDHIADLYRTKGYTGFSVFYEGYERAGRIGGDWDELLKEYCRGERRDPVWVIAGLAFDQGTAEDLGRSMDDLKVWLLAESVSHDALMEAMRRGRVVVSRGRSETMFVLDEFSVEDTGTGRRATLGGEVSVRGVPRIRMRGHYEGALPSPVSLEVRLVRDGELVKTFGEPDVVFEDALRPVSGKGYYRLEVRNGSQLLVTNPIFLTAS